MGPRRQVYSCLLCERSQHPLSAPKEPIPYQVSMVYRSIEYIRTLSMTTFEDMSNCSCSNAEANKEASSPGVRRLDSVAQNSETMFPCENKDCSCATRQSNAEQRCQDICSGRKQALLAEERIRRQFEILPSIDRILALANRLNTTSSVDRAEGMPSPRSQIPAPTSRRSSPQPDGSYRSSRRSPSRSPKVHTAGLNEQEVSSPVTIPKVTNHQSRQDKEPASSIDITQIQSHFVGPHLGTPCTLGALDHRIQCGHKVMTARPERCGPNCQTHSSALANARSAEQPFVCMACIVGEVKRARDAKAISFQEELKAVAKASGKPLLRKEIARHLEVMEIGWRELDLKHLRENVKHGRLSHPFYVEPEYADAVEMIISECYAKGREETKTSLPKVKSADRHHSVCQCSERTRSANRSCSRSSSRSSSNSAHSSESTKSRLPVRGK